MVGPTATQTQLTNANIANFLYQTWEKLSKLSEEQAQPLADALGPSIQVRLVLYMLFLTQTIRVEIQTDIGLHLGPRHHSDPTRA